MTVSRSRWAAIGAAIAVSLGAGGIGIGHATTDSSEGPVSAFFPIEPCRLAADAVVLADSSITLDGWGITGECDLPSGLTGLAANVTAINASQQTNLRFFAQGDPVPETANLNPSPGAPPAPNAVNIPLNSSNGQFQVYNRFGIVGVFIDVMGYYDDHTHDDRYVGKTRTLMVPPSAFQAVSPSLEVTVGNIFGTYISGGGPATESLRAPLPIVAGSTIHSITYHYIDNSIADALSLNVVRTALTSNSQALVGPLGVETTGASPSPRSTTVDVDYVVPDGFEFALGAFNTNWTSLGNALTVKGVQIEYTLP